MVKKGQRIVKGVDVKVTAIGEIEAIADQSATKPMIGRVILQGWDGTIYRDVAVDTGGKVKVTVT